MPSPAVKKLITQIINGKIGSWDDVHAFYADQSASYEKNKTMHAFAAMLEVLKLHPSRFSKPVFSSLLQKALTTREWMTKCIYESRAKDYENPFRTMVYNTHKEMELVIGKLKDNSFIRQQQEELTQFKKQVQQVKRDFSI